MDEAVIRVRDALAQGELAEADLTARSLGAFLGKTTSVLYHHWGSLDGFLYAVGQSSFDLLGARISGDLGSADPGDLAAAFVDFGLECPALYALMFERPYDWQALRAAGAFGAETRGLTVFTGLVALFEARGSDDPATDARLFFAGLHGLVALAATGRANVGDLGTPDRDVALAAARRLADHLFRFDGGS